MLRLHLHRPLALKSSSRLFSHSLRVSIVTLFGHICHFEECVFNSILAMTWRIVYIGQASDPAYDQILEEAEMDEIQPGQMKFVFEVS
jgi:hypothetical protein